jgi:hypothetical protein
MTGAGVGQANDVLGRLLDGPVCFDATVPLYLSEVGMASTLSGAFRNRAYIPGGVFREIDGLSRSSFPAASTLITPRCFARVIALSPGELDLVFARQRRWNGERAFDDPTEDRGEAECIQLCLRDPDRAMALCAHDHKVRGDPDARGIKILNAIHVCTVFALRGKSTDEAWDAYRGLLRRGMNEVLSFPPDPRGKGLFNHVVARARARREETGAR